MMNSRTNIKSNFKETNMNRRNITKILTSVLISYVVSSISAVYSTPSTQVWIPSTDIQDYKTIHLGIDNYFTMFTKLADGAYALPTDIGLTYGLFPQIEIGIDIFEPTDYPLMFNFKISILKTKLSKYSTSVSFGGYYFGTEKDVSDLNVVYGLIGKKLGNIGRFSLGYYKGNRKLLIPDDNGILFSFDRCIPEISEKLWFGLDYQGGKNSIGAFNFGFSWSFNEKVSLLVGYDIYNISNIKNTITTQLDINF